MPPYTSPTRLARGVYIAFGILAVLYAILTLEIIMTDRAVGMFGADASQSEAFGLLLAALVLLATAGFYLAAFAASSALFLMWLRRVRGNLPGLNASDVKYTPGWAIGWFFVPVISLFRPYQVLAETARASDPEVTGPDSRAWKSASSPAAVKWWWSLVIAMSVVGIADSTLSRLWSDSLGSNFLTYASVMAAYKSWSSIAVLLVALGAIAATILMVRTITSFQERKHRLLAPAAEPAAPIPTPPNPGASYPAAG